jgi:hypothetical protein
MAESYTRYLIVKIGTKSCIIGERLDLKPPTSEIMSLYVTYVTVTILMLKSR